MAALCQAVETKDLYTRGHRERVSRGAVMIGREIGMRASRVEAILYAVMLPDVGKLGGAHHRAAEGRAADGGGVRGHPAAPHARPGDRPGGRVPGRGPGWDHARDSPRISRTTAVAYSSCPAATSSRSSSPLQGRARDPLRSPAAPAPTATLAVTGHWSSSGTAGEADPPHPEPCGPRLKRLKSLRTRPGRWSRCGQPYGPRRPGQAEHPISRRAAGPRR